MEGFTLVILIAWLILLASFAVMYHMDRVVQEAERRKSPDESEPKK